MRVQPIAKVSDWLRSVAEVLPLQHLEVLPYTLGEAVAELGAYAQAVGALGWNLKPSKDNRASLRNEIEVQSETLWQRLGALIASVLDDLRDDSDPEILVEVAARFDEVWHSKVAVTDAFRDLCDAAKVSGTTSRALRKLSAIIAAQVGPAAIGAFSLLSQAADALVNTGEDLARWRGAPLSEPLTEALRIEMAKDILIAAPTGRVTVWTVYYRAIISRGREVAGPMTFLEADWALPNAFDIELSDFPERAELHEIHDEVRWLDDVNVEASKAENRLALVRIDLGERQIAGAIEEARRRIEAALSIAVEAGGVSWQSAGVAAVLLDGKVRSSSFGLTLTDAPGSDDTYGMVATGDMLTKVADQLGDVLAKGPMPEHLVEALTSLREARMTDHRDVLFYGSRRITARVATALEDHAMELIARMLEVHPKALAEALQRREALAQADRQIASQITTPFNEAWSREPHEGRQQLEERIFAHSHGRRVVSVAEVVALQAEIRGLPMSDLQRADLEDALAICTEPMRERQLLDEMRRKAGVLRARHRRVRNAINHGLPLNETTLNSIRDYANETSGTAINIALSWFKSGERGAALLKREEDDWAQRMDRIADGLSLAMEDTRAEKEL